MGCSDNYGPPFGYILYHGTEYLGIPKWTLNFRVPFNLNPNFRNYPHDVDVQGPASGAAPNTEDHKGNSQQDAKIFGV